MSSELVLGALLLLTNAFWALQCHRLVNKLMSRNYFEFKQAEAPPEKKSAPQVYVDEAEDFGALSEIMPR